MLPVAPVPGSAQLVDRNRFAGANIDARATVATGFRIDGCDFFHQLDGVQRAGINALGTSGALLSVHDRCHQTGLPFQNSQNLNSQTTHSVLYTRGGRRLYLKPRENDHPRLGGREATASGASVGGKRGQVSYAATAWSTLRTKSPFPDATLFSIECRRRCAKWKFPESGPHFPEISRAALRLSRSAQYRGSGRRRPWSSRRTTASAWATVVRWPGETKIGRRLPSVARIATPRS